MKELSRRSFLERSAVAAVGAAATGALVDAAPAGAATYTGNINGPVLDEGGQVFNIKGSSYGAVGDGTTDDTAAIVSAVAAASAVGGTVYAPQGTYLIKGASNGNAPIEISGTVGLIGCGAKAKGTDDSSTVFLCGDSTAGILANGSGTFQGFRVDGGTVATVPMQNGTVSGGEANLDSWNATFIDVWVINSAGTGWTIYGAQGNSYYDCRSYTNTLDGVYIDAGASGLDFWHWQESENARYGIHGDETYSRGGSYGTNDIRFHSGLCDSVSTTSNGPKVYLRGATNWSLRDMNIDGKQVNTTSYPNAQTIDLDQSSGYGIDLSRSLILGRAKNSVPGYPCIYVQNSTPADSPERTFLITDGAFFISGDTSIWVAEPSNYTYSAIGWSYDATANGGTGGPYAPSGYAGIDTVLTGRTGAWQKVSVSTSRWSGTVYYRVDSDGVVRFKGNVSSLAAGGGPIINPLALGYRPASNLTLPVTTSNSATGSITISTAGVVTGSSLPLGKKLYLDGLTFVPKFPA